MLGLGLGINKISKITHSVSNPDLILDNISGAKLAFSLHKLYKDYAGNCLKVRRSSDNATQDIGFTLSNYVDSSAIALFCSGTDGFIDTWYNQYPGGNNATQASTANQPKICSSGTFINDGILFNGADSFLVISKYADINITTSPLAIYASHANTTSTAGYVITCNTDNYNTQQYGVRYSSTTSYFYLADSIKVQGAINSGNNLLFVWKSTSASQTKIKNDNGELTGTNSSNLSQRNFVVIGARSNNATATSFSNFFAGNLKTVIIFNTDVESELTDLQNY